MREKVMEDRLLGNSMIGPLSLFPPKSVPTGGPPLPSTPASSRLCPNWATGKMARKKWPTENQKHSGALSGNWATWDTGPQISEDIPSMSAMRARSLRHLKSAGREADGSKKFVGTSYGAYSGYETAQVSSHSCARGPGVVVRGSLPHGSRVVLFKPARAACRNLCGCLDKNGGLPARKNGEV